MSTVSGAMLDDPAMLGMDDVSAVGADGAALLPPEPAPPPDPEAEKERRKKEWSKWQKRLDEARVLRDKEEAEVWKPLRDVLVGSLLIGKGDADLANGFAQFEDMLMPHLLGDDRQCNFKVTKIAAEESAEDKFAFAKMLGDQATALGKAIGLYVDAVGTPGELPKCYRNFLWGMGVLVFGFDVPGGTGQQPVENPGQAADGETREVDLDFESADRMERQDAGMPWARSYSPCDVLIDGTYLSIAKAGWFAVRCFWSLAGCKKKWPDFKWQRTDVAVPAGSEEHATAARGDEEGVVELHYVYQRDPLQRLVIPAKGSGVDEVVAVEDLDLGIEGLPLLVLGGKWFDGRLYPKPKLADLIGPANAENQFLQTVRAAGEKLRTIVATFSEKFANQLRDGDDNGVYVLDKSDGALKDQLQTEVVGAIRKELLDLQETWRENLERSSGLGDMQLGLREPGDPNVPQIQARNAALSVRLQGALKPVRDFEAAAHHRLMAVAYSKLDLLNGMQLPVTQGASVQLAVFDANRPVVGEWLDYVCEVQVSDALTNSDQMQAATAAMEVLGNAEPRLNAMGKYVDWPLAIAQYLRNSPLERGDEMVKDIPQGPPAASMPGDPNAGGGAANGAAPPDELQQLYQALQSAPEGSPQEDQILQRIAQLTAQPQAAAAA